MIQPTLAASPQFHMADGKTLLDGDVENLVSAMSAFSVTAAGQTTLTADDDAVLAAKGIDVNLFVSASPRA